jgi:hypothetical protein
MEHRYGCRGEQRESNGFQQVLQGEHFFSPLMKHHASSALDGKRGSSALQIYKVLGLRNLKPKGADSKRVNR